MVKTEATLTSTGEQVPDASGHRDELAAMLSEAEAKLANASARLLDAAREQDSLATALRQTEAELATCMARLSDRKREIDGLADALRTSEAREANTAARLSDAERKIGELGDALRASEAREANIAASLGDAERHRDMLASALHHMEATLVTAEARLEDAERKRGRLAAPLNQAGPPGQRHDDHGQPLQRSLPFMPRQIIFVHVAKCGGTALANYLHNMLEPCREIRNNITFLEKCPTEYVHSMDFIYGHLSWKHLQKRKPGAFVFTMLRDPVDRVLSNYFFIRTLDNTGRKPQYPVFVAACQNLQLHELVREDHPQIRYWISNYMARQLSRQNDEMAICPPSQLAREAIENLRLYDHVGIHEDFAASLNILQFMLNWPFVESLPQTNVTENRVRLDEIDPETAAAIRSINTADVALYDHVAKEHRRRCDVLRPLIEQRRGAMMAHQPLASPV